ncbi:hypothetical protein B4U80_13904 [Leptotrombidium deliense]|uniref:MD-2-related lipid-recognition domain-containing protein n=1 Tax=Leptotrombidium deliense TaxID=299467 RepID=A0A443S8H4_9ACAR|nr:hypothetical protein B4U80_13904 [Leptotrombidium deliense]
MPKRKQSKIITFEDLRISPEDPKLGKQLTLGTTVKVDDFIEPGSISDLRIKKYVGRLFFSVPVKLPCVNGFGSCKTDLCKIFKNKDVCKVLKEIGGNCECPFQPNVYKYYNGEPIQVPTAKGLGGLFAKGKYAIEWRIISPKGEELGCLSGEVKLNLNKQNVI